MDLIVFFFLFSAEFLLPTLHMHSVNFWVTVVLKGCVVNRFHFNIIKQLLSCRWCYCLAKISWLNLFFKLFKTIRNSMIRQLNTLPWMHFLEYQRQPAKRTPAVSLHICHSEHETARNFVACGFKFGFRVIH